MSSPRSSRFSPHLVPVDRLAALFVGRWPVVDRLVDDTLAVAIAGGARYEVVVAPRGAGKSHLFALVAARLRERGEAAGIVVAQLAEEEYPASLVDLLSRFLLALPPVEGLPGTADHLGVLRRARREEQLATAVALLETRVGDHPLVLLAENLDRIFEALGRSGQQALRSILSAHPRWSVVATSCTHGPDFTDAKAPFYKTFARVTLPDLTDAQALEMLRRLAREHEDDKLLAQLDTPDGEVRVRAIRFLVGDNPRAMALLFPFLREGRLDDLEGVFLDLAEELTPYFQDQMSRIPAGQRPYLELLAAHWGPRTVGELADATFATPQIASGQLRYLKRDGLVTGMQVGREVYYELAEPLHRLASAMKHPERAPVTLARFLVAWLPRGRIEAGWTDAGRQDRDPWALALRLGGEPEGPYEGHVGAEVQRLAREGKVDEAVVLAREGWDRTHGPLIGSALLTCLWAQAPTDAARFAAEFVEQCPGGGWLGALLGVLYLGVDLAPPLLTACLDRLAALPESELMGDVAVVAVALGPPDGPRWEAAVRGLRARPPAGPSPGVIPRLVAGGEPEFALELALGWGLDRIDGDSFDALTSSLGERESDRLLPALIEALVSGEGRTVIGAWRACGVAVHATDLATLMDARGRLAAAPPTAEVDLVAAVLAHECGDVEESAARVEGLVGAPVVAGNEDLFVPFALAAGRWGLARSLVERGPEDLRECVAWLVDIATGSDAPMPRPAFGDRAPLLDGLASWLVTTGPAQGERIRAALADLPKWSEVLEFQRLIHVARAKDRGQPLRERSGSAASPLLDALHALPDDLTPFARLAAPERRALRHVLRRAGAEQLLRVLPAEPT